MRTRQIAAIHGGSQQGAMNALRRLPERGIVEERVRRGRTSFTAARVVELLSQ
jgi:DNA-binding transcriptional MocR family regulator